MTETDGQWKTPEPYMTRHQLAEFLQVHPHTIDQYIAEGCPSEVWGKRTRRFQKTPVLEWLRQRGAQYSE